MKLFLRALKVMVFSTLLTLLTQVGGLIYLLYQPFGALVRQRVKPGWRQKGYRLTTFFCLYLLCTLFVIPPLAKKTGRVPLPWFASEAMPVKPHNFLASAMLNRHYVQPSLKSLLQNTAIKMQKEAPGLRINYLDANFPFWNEFPLLPHLSHDDGKKVDISFLYRYQSDETLRKRGSSFLGYGVCEAPKKGEVDWPARCTARGEWQYSALKQITPQRQHQLYFDESLNRRLLTILASDQRTGKIFIEKHLEDRLRLNPYGKIRQAGCHSVRHDDHIHVQL